MTYHVLKYRPNESLASEDYNIEVTPIAVGESDSNNIEMFAPDNIGNKRPDESLALEDDNIEAIPIDAGDECGTKKVNKKKEVNSKNIEIFSGGLEVKTSLEIDSCVNVFVVGNPGASKTTLCPVINDTAAGPFVEGLFVDEHEEEKERVSYITLECWEKSNENGQRNASPIMSGKTKSKEILRANKTIDRALDAKKVFNRHKGSTDSATGFSSQRQANYSLSSKLCEVVWQFLYLKLSLLICIVNCIPFSDLNDALLVYDKSTIKSTVGVSVWFESLNY
ncbi:PREDICTED: uncharacterized protein LOC109593323, partial [Amphimedon queenslandica]|uniref:Uncharacterized protein n=1 Tax=Amphimedon queenslandica TaxID=400682 RepID=A0AAN0K3B1_AMPQE